MSDKTEDLLYRHLIGLCSVILEDRARRYTGMWAFEEAHEWEIPQDTIDFLTARLAVMLTHTPEGPVDRLFGIKIVPRRGTGPGEIRLNEIDIFERMKENE